MSLQSIKGMNDIVPPNSNVWQEVEASLRDILRRYAYREIRLPIMEQTAVFKRSIGDVTDIVQKEMYTFEDRNGDSLSLRPEGTAACVRAVLQHGLVHQQYRKLWYMGPMFRHERPQKGRYRQFHQIGVEVFDHAGPDVDAELIIMTARMWQGLGLKNLRLELNTLGTLECRKAYRGVLQEYFEAHREELDTDSVTRLERNPMRILDSKNPELKTLIAAAPKLQDHLDDESRAHFAGLCKMLEQANVSFELNPLLVRGLDYYSNTVFEWITDELGAQGTVCAGGRYDGLVEVMGGKPTPAIGCAMGLERLIELASSQQTAPDITDADIYLVIADTAYSASALGFAEQLRDANPDWRVMSHFGGGSIKSQMKKANRSGAIVAAIIGADEFASGRVTIKALRREIPQQTVALNEAFDVISAAFA